MNGIQEVRGSTPRISTKEKGRHQPSFFFVEMRGREALCKPQARKKAGPFSDQRERRAACPAHPKDGVWIQAPRRALAAISTIAEPVEPKGLAGFSLCPEVGRINQVPIGCGQDLPRRQTEIPTESQKSPVGILYTYGQFKSNITTPSRYEI